jgi:osmoprotectant transport system substrate-binding protein
MKKNTRTIFMAMFICVSLFKVSPAWACVGRKIFIGYCNNTEQRVICELLGILIEERTGTKVIFKEHDDTMDLHRALEANEIQIYVEYTGIGLTEILGVEPMKDPVQAYKKVKSEYNKNFNLIWLKTFGYSSTNKENEKLNAAGIPLFAAPVVRKDTLKKFPALSRLLNKLSGKIDNKVMADLVTEVEQKGKETKGVAGRFLNKLGISFSFTPGVG